MQVAIERGGTILVDAAEGRWIFSSNCRGDLGNPVATLRSEFVKTEGLCHEIVQVSRYVAVRALPDMLQPITFRSHAVISAGGFRGTW